MTRHRTASAVVIDPDAQVVLLVWHNATGKWMVPGGHVDTGESFTATAVREVLEETGVRARLVSAAPIDVADYPAPAKPERPGKPAEDAHWHTDHLFAAVADSTTGLTAAVDEVAQVRWQPVDRLHELDVRAEVPTVVAAALDLIGGAR